MSPHETIAHYRINWDRSGALVMEFSIGADLSRC
jgi:hypothetical protein